MELRHLRYFIRAAELMNFTKAAESLYVSQPTLSVQIHQLEEELGTELFTRIGRNIRLTESGKVFLQRAIQAVRELEEGSKEIDAINGLLRGSLCISSLPLYGSYRMPAWVAAFNALHPLVYMRIMAAPTEDIEASILSGTVDLGISFLPPQHSELNSLELFKDEIVVVASTKNEICRKKDKLSTEDFLNLKLALPSERISATRLIGVFFEEQGIHPTLSMSFDDGHALIEFVKQSDFVTFLPRGSVKPCQEVCMLEMPEPGIKLSTGALWIKLSPAAQAFLNLVAEKH